MTSATARGTITYDEHYGHVCTCTEATHYDDDGYPAHVSYRATVKVVASVEPTESGSYYYCCDRCGTGGWSGL